MSDFNAISVGRRVLTAEAEALGQLAAELDEAFTQAVETLFDAKGRVVLTGIGKSGHVARKIAAPWPPLARSRCSCTPPRPATATWA